MMKHTQWGLPEGYNVSELQSFGIPIKDENGDYIALVKGKNQIDNAEFIVRACNNYDAMVGALEQVLFHENQRIESEQAAGAKLVNCSARIIAKETLDKVRR